METEPAALVIHEGFILDDAERLILTLHFDLRPPAERVPIRALVKGCRPEHALEAYDTLLISKPSRFHEVGEALVQDDREGNASKESKEESLQEFDLPVPREISDLNEALEIVGSQVASQLSHTGSSTRQTRNSSVDSLRFGEDLWIYCASLEPEPASFDSWRATLPDDYTHASTIGQPAKFAQALARMVAEQLGPQGTPETVTQTMSGNESESPRHPTQVVVHGPVVYSDNVYEALAEAPDDIRGMASYIFTKRAEFAEQREYRFAVLNGGGDEEAVGLQISGLMRDALQRTDHGLRRSAPHPVSAPSDDATPRESNSSTVSATNQNVTSKTQKSIRKEVRSTLKTRDGQVLSKSVEQHEHIIEEEDQASAPALPFNGPGEDVLQNIQKHERTVAPLNVEQDAREDKPGPNDETTVQRLAAAGMDERESNASEDNLLMVQIGRIHRQMEDMVTDPSFPFGPSSNVWQEGQCTAEEIAKTYAAVEALNIKMQYIPQEYRHEVASAGWYALHCKRNIYATLGDVFESLAVENHRFIVLRLKPSNERGASGRIVVSPSGVYAYCLRLPNKELSGHGGEHLGTWMFPLGTAIEPFEDFGWESKGFRS